MIEKAAQRKIPLTFQLLLLGLLLLSSDQYKTMPELYGFFLGGMTSILVALSFLYLNRKISLHMCGIAALTSFAMALSLETGENLTRLIALLFATSGAVAASRLYLKAHNATELLLGLVTGALPQWVLGYLWL